MEPTSDHIRQTDASRATSIIARSLFKEMRQQGYTSEQIIGVSSELLNLVSANIREDSADLEELRAAE